MLAAALSQVPYPSWLNPADNTWQMTAATFVGLMSLPGLAVLYASIVPKKWAVNVLAMMFAGFSLVLIAWVSVVLQDGIRGELVGGGVKNGVQTQLTGVGGLTHFFDNFWGKPGADHQPQGEQGQAVSAANTVIPFHFPTASLAYFQFVFAAITPLLFLGSVLGRIKFSAWCLLVPLWSTCVYSVDAFLLWGGGYFAQEGALDFSGGYVIHMSAGVSGLRGRLGPRTPAPAGPTTRLPNNLVMAAVGAGILWLGWNGFNGGDPYYAGADAASAVVNTNLATAAGVIVWIAMDAWLSKEKKPTFLGAVNGMICGLVGITPCAGWVNGQGAIAVGRSARPSCGWPGTSCPRCGRSPRWTMPWESSTPTASPASSAACCSASSVTRACSSTAAATWTQPGRSSPPPAPVRHGGDVRAVRVNGLIYTGSAHQLWEQFRAAIWVIFWSALVTFILMKIIGLVLRGARYKDEILEVGDLAIHGEEAFPEETFAERVGAISMAGERTGSRSASVRNRTNRVTIRAGQAADTTTTTRKEKCNMKLS